VFGYNDGHAVPFEIVFGLQNGGGPLELQRILKQALELTMRGGRTNLAKAGAQA